MSQFYGPTVSKLFTKYRPLMPLHVAHRIQAYLAEHRTGPFNVVDVGCGTGLSTRRLAEVFTGANSNIVGIDNSSTQLEEARFYSADLSHVQYELCDVDSEQMPFEEGSIDLVTCAQSFHWLNMPRFFQSCDKILKNNGVLAIVCYPLVQPRISNEFEGYETIDRKLADLVKRLNDQLQEGGYWAMDRRLVIDKFASVQFPYKDQRRFLDDPAMELVKEGTIDDLFGYLDSWSASRNYVEQNPTGQMIQEFKNDFFEVLPAPLKFGTAKLDAVFPFYLIMTRKN